MQIVDGAAGPVRDPRRQGRGGDHLRKSAKIIRSLLPIRDAIRDVLRAQAANQPWAQAQVRLRVAYSAFIRYFGPINHTVDHRPVTDADTGEERETHRRPNLAPFADDPDCWLVASIEDYDLETGLARKGPIFSERVIAPPAAPLITSRRRRARRHPDRDRARRSRPHGRPAGARAGDGAGPTRDGGLPQPAHRRMGNRGRLPVRCGASKLAVAEAAAALDPQYERNVIALRDVQPKDCGPLISPRGSGAPWIPTDVIEAFCGRGRWAPRRGAGTAVELATWTVDARPLHRHRRRHVRVGHRSPQRRSLAARCAEQLDAADLRHRDRGRRREARAQRRGDGGGQGKAAQASRTRSPTGSGRDPDRTDRLARIYNDRFNNLVPRAFRWPPPDPARREQHHPAL